jgi:hypothetical protein
MIRPVANDNPPAGGEWSRAGLWLQCDCGSVHFGFRLDESTGLQHVICQKCGDDNSIKALS